jgi:type I restriction enzyme S subunit
MSFVIPKNTGTSIPQLTVPNLKNSIVKYPPLEEQQKIVQQLDELQEQTKKLEQIYTQKLQDLDELKQSILQKAFNGEL